jgi:hypothetical protein
MLTLLSGIAAVVLAELLYISAWLSANPRAWQYYLWAILVILAWSQPWRSRDPYRTDSQLFRRVVYGALFVGASASAVIFELLPPGLIGVGVVGLFVVEWIGRRAIRRT